MTVIPLDHTHVYEDNECIVRITDKQGEPLTNATGFFYLAKALADFLLPDEED